jgi:hypothetical protein
MSQREHGAWSCDFSTIGKYDEYERDREIEKRDDLIGSSEHSVQRMIMIDTMKIVKLGGRWRLEVIPHVMFS